MTVQLLAVEEQETELEVALVGYLVIKDAMKELLPNRKHATNRYDTIVA